MRRLQREQGACSHVFMTERDGPMTPKAFHALFGRSSKFEEFVPYALGGTALLVIGQSAAAKLGFQHLVSAAQNNHECSAAKSTSRRECQLERDGCYAEQMSRRIEVERSGLTCLLSATIAGIYFSSGLTAARFV